MPDNALDAPELPGYLVTGVLGAGSNGPVWSAVRRHDGCPVAVKVVPAGGHEELAVLRGVRHPHVVALLDDIALPGHRVALVMERCAGGSLARLVRARGHLTAGETVTVATTVASTLADLHRLGVTHGDISPGNVVLQSDGRPMLVDLGVARIAGLGDRQASGTDGFIDPRVLEGCPAGPDSDVYALGALAWFCLCGEPPPPAARRRPLLERRPDVPVDLAAAVEAALAPDPGERIAAAELAWRVYDACSPEAVVLAAGPDPVAELTHRIRALARADPTVARTARRTMSGRVLAACRHRVGRWLGGTTVLVAAVIGLVVLRPAAAAGPQRPSWASILAQLTAAREAAFGRPELGPAAFDVVGSPAWSRDEAALSRLRAQALHYEHLTMAVATVREVSAGRDRVVLRARVATSAYDVVGRGTRLRRPPTAERDIVVDLARDGSGWRVSAVRQP